MSNVEPVMTMLEQKGDVKILASSRTPKGTEEMFGGAMPAATLYAYDDFLKKNPNTAQALANAIVRADKWLAKAGPSDVSRPCPSPISSRQGALSRRVQRAARGVLARRPDARFGSGDRGQGAREFRPEDRSREGEARRYVDERLREAREPEVQVTQARVVVERRALVRAGHLYLHLER